jgi:hypothetical protein
MCNGQEKMIEIYLVACKYENFVKPFPKRKVSLREWVFAEHCPCDYRVVILIWISEKIAKVL